MNLSEFLRSEYSLQPHFLLFGNPVSHSLSPLMHNTAAQYYNMDITYHAVTVNSLELSTLAAHLNEDSFKGGNITIPHKQVLIDYVDELDETASAIGAINTIVKQSSSLIGYNTDSYGFSMPLQEEEVRNKLRGGRALIFGTGGATRAIVYALHELEVREIILISRNPAKNHGFERRDSLRIEGYDAWTTFAEESEIIINATPVGMKPDIDSSPIRDDEQNILENKICYDIVYKPLKTKFLSLAGSAGARTIGGLEMLIHQGSRSFELWTGYPFPIQEVRSKLYETIRD